MRTKEALENRTFDNEYVFDPDEPAVKKMIDIMAFMAGMPISYQIIKQAEERGASRSEEVLGAFGIKRAPYNFDLEPDEDMALKLLADRSKSKPLTKEDAKARRAVREAIKKYQKGDTITSDDVRQMMRDGLISPGSERSILRYAKKPWIYRLFMHLDAEDKLKVFAAASPEHKAKLRELLHLTRRDLMFYPKPKFHELRTEMEKAREGGAAGPQQPMPAPVPSSLYQPHPAPVPQEY